MRAQFFRCIFAMLQSDSAAVAYGAARTIVMLSSSPSAVRAAAQTYTQLLASQSENNIKLVVLSQLDSLRRVVYYRRVLGEMVMDILKALHTPVGCEG